MCSPEFKYATATRNKIKAEGTLGYIRWANHFSPRDSNISVLLYHSSIQKQLCLVYYLLKKNSSLRAWTGTYLSLLHTYLTVSETATHFKITTIISCIHQITRNLVHTAKTVKKYLLKIYPNIYYTALLTHLLCSIFSSNSKRLRLRKYSHTLSKYSLQSFIMMH